MTRRPWAALLIVTMLGTCLQSFAQDLVAPKLLPAPSSLRTGIAARNLSFGAGDDPSQQAPPPHRHWSKTGKILTIVGAGLIGAGTVALVHGQNTRVLCASNGNGETCADIAWRATGAGWTAGGAVLLIVGVTRHTED
jgi:hypothetical protein